MNIHKGIITNTSPFVLCYRYQEGMLHSKIGDPGTTSLIEGATAGLVAAVEKDGLDAVDDTDVDELLDWTNALNFDE